MAVDVIAGSWAAIEGTEFVNNTRTTAYLKAGFGPPSLQVLADCECSEEVLRPLVDCDALPYSTPAADNASWFDPLQPESAFFAGFYMTDFTGYDSTYKRDIFPLITGGGVLGRLVPGPRTLKWSGFLFGKTCCSVAFGLKWLTSVLRQGRCGSECFGEQMDLLWCCPQDQPVCVGTDVMTADNAFRTVLRVGLLDGPHVKSVRRASGCGCGCSAIMEVEFSIIAGNPYFYRAPLTLANAVPFGEIDCPEWIKVPPGTCPPVPVCPDPQPCTVDTRPQCIPIAPPIIPQFVDPCACDPLNPVKFCTNFLAANVEAMFNGEPIFQIYSGSMPIRNAQIQIYANPQGLNCDDIISDPCNACTNISIRFIPANATLTIDSTLKRITIECAGGSIQPGEPFLTGTFDWPVFECIDYCICVQVDGISVAPDATYSIDVWPREM